MNVSIPSRRVGDLVMASVAECASSVSIPSRRVGDRFGGSGSWVCRVFPSPQGGSETYQCRRRCGCRTTVSIPSRRVGDGYAHQRPFRPATVSIPSRRVGDKDGCVWSMGDFTGFHHLKAGRRHQRLNFSSDLIRVSIPSRRVGDDFRDFEAPALQHVSIPSRRVGDLSYSAGGNSELICFHPLKAGRRRPNRAKY